MKPKTKYSFCKPPQHHPFTYVAQGESADAENGRRVLAEKFGQDPEKLKQEGIRFLFAANNYSYSGELADTFVFFVDKHGQAFEVWGPECSVWDFNGQWEPEEVVVRHWMNSLDDEYGMGLSRNDGENLWRMEFIQALDHLYPYFDEDSQQAMRDASDELKQYMPYVLAACLNEGIGEEVDLQDKPHAKPKLM